MIKFSNLTSSNFLDIIITMFVNFYKVYTNSINCSRLRFLGHPVYSLAVRLCWHSILLQLEKRPVFPVDLHRFHLSLTSFKLHQYWNSFSSSKTTAHSNNPCLIRIHTLNILIVLISLITITLMSDIWILTAQRPGAARSNKSLRIASQI